MGIAALTAFPMMPTATIEASATTKRLRPIPRLAVAGLCLISLAVSVSQSTTYISHGPSYSDFRIFMTGIAIVKSGNAHDLYNFETQRIEQIKLYPATRMQGLLPFNHLAFELLIYWPFSYFHYQTAILLWAAINVAVVFLIGWLLKPYTRTISERTGIPIALYLVAFYPVIYVLGEGQDSLIFLLLLVLSLRAMDSKIPFLAGMLLALGCFKLHLALLMGFFVLFAGRKWKGVMGFVVGGAVAGIVSLLMVGPHLFPDYLNMMRMQEMVTPWGFIPWFMPNLRGFFRWTLRAYLDPGQMLPVVFMTSAIVAVIAAWFVIRRQVRGGAGLLYSVAILTTVLISYHLHMQDLSMAVLPMLVVVDRAWQNPIAQSNRLRGWLICLAISVCGLYYYRLVAEVFPTLLYHSCFAAVPVFFFWVAALQVFSKSQAAAGVAPNTGQEPGLI